MKTLVLGLGNPILTDDGIGIHVVRQAAAQFRRSGGADVTFAEASAGGLRLLETISGFNRLILVDAIQTRGHPPAGRSYRLRVPDISGVADVSDVADVADVSDVAGLQSGKANTLTSLHAGSTHDLSFAGALAFGRSIGLALPTDEDIIILAVEAEDVLTFSESLTPAVAAALPRIVDELLCELNPKPAREATYEPQGSAANH